MSTPNDGGGEAEGNSNSDNAEEDQQVEPGTANAYDDEASTSQDYTGARKKKAPMKKNRSPYSKDRRARGSPDRKFRGSAKAKNRARYGRASPNDNSKSAKNRKYKKDRLNNKRPRTDKPDDRQNGGGNGFFGLDMTKF